MSSIFFVFLGCLILAFAKEYAAAVFTLISAAMNALFVGVAFEEYGKFGIDKSKNSFIMAVIFTLIQPLVFLWLSTVPGFMTVNCSYLVINGFRIFLLVIAAFNLLVLGVFLGRYERNYVKKYVTVPTIAKVSGKLFASIVLFIIGFWLSIVMMISFSKTVLLVNGIPSGSGILFGLFPLVIAGGIIVWIWFWMK